MEKYLINIVIADDHPAFLIGVEQVLGASENIKITGKAANSSQLVEILDKETCDILVADYLMPGGEYSDGLALMTLIQRRYPHIKIVILTMLDSPLVLRPLIDMGIHSIVSKADEPSHLIPAVHVAAAQGNYYSPSIASIVKSFKENVRGTSTNQVLSRKEAEVIRLYASGINVTDIAIQLNRTKQTISTQKTNAMKKLGIARDIDLYKYAISQGLIKPD